MKTASTKRVLSKLVTEHTGLTEIEVNTDIHNRVFLVAAITGPKWARDFVDHAKVPPGWIAQALGNYIVRFTPQPTP